MNNIKSIDEHEWSDGNIKSARVDSEGDVSIVLLEPANCTGFSREDLDVIANALGYKLTKIGGE